MEGVRHKKRRTEVERRGGGGRKGGVGEASVFPVNKIKRKWLFYSQVRSRGRVAPVCARQREKG